MIPKANKPAVAPRPGAPGKPAAAPTRNAYRDAFLKGTGPAESAEVLFARCAELQDALEALRVRYEQFFLGLSRHPPRREHALLKSELLRLRSGFLRNTGVKFRATSSTTACWPTTACGNGPSGRWRTAPTDAIPSAPAGARKAQEARKRARPRASSMRWRSAFRRPRLRSPRLPSPPRRPAADSATRP